MSNLEERERELGYILNGIKQDCLAIRTCATNARNYHHESVTARARMMVRDTQFSICGGDLEAAIARTAEKLGISKSRVRKAALPGKRTKRQLESMERTALREAASYAQKSINLASAAQLKMDRAKRLRAEIEGKPDPDFYTP